MLKLNKADYARAYRLYLEGNGFFPLIAAVLQDQQDGVVYVDDDSNPSRVYVEHAFGFAQIFGQPAELFENALKKYMLEEPPSHAGKIRLYVPDPPAIQLETSEKAALSWRQRFVWSAQTPARLEEARGNEDKVRFQEVNHDNIATIDSQFKVVNRFWRTPADFIAHANAVVLLYEGQPASICYAAATADHKAEIDVMTLPDFRKLGLAKVAVLRFIQRCQGQSIQPLWDCFANNIASMSLARSIGFQPKGSPYRFYTITK